MPTCAARGGGPGVSQALAVGLARLVASGEWTHYLWLCRDIPEERGGQAGTGCAITLVWNVVEPVGQASSGPGLPP